MAPALETKYVFTITAEIGGVTSTGDIGHGVRRIIPITGGEVRGEGVNGKVCAFGAEPPGQLQSTVARGSRRTVAVVVVWDSSTIRWLPCRSGVTVTGPPPVPGVAGVPRRTALNVRVAVCAPLSRAVTVMDTVPAAGVVIATRSSTVVTPSTTMVIVIGAIPPPVSTYSVECSGSWAAPPPGSAMYSPASVWNRQAMVGLPPRFTTSASKTPVTPACAPRPIHVSRTPALTARPCTPFGETKSRASGRKNPCQSPGIARAVGGTPLGPAVPERSRTAVRKANPTTSLGPTSA